LFINTIKISLEREGYAKKIEIDRKNQKYLS